jgi:hypothetical protein
MATALCLTQQPGRLGAQNLAEQRSRVDSLRADWEQKRDTLLTVVRGLGSVTVDTVRAGPFTVIADEPVAELMNRAVPIAWETLREALGSDSMLAAVKPIHFASGSSRRVEPSEHVISGPWIDEDLPLDDVVDRIIATVGRELSQALAERNRLWLSVGPLTRVAAERRGWSWVTRYQMVYLELATSASAVGRRCHAGDLAACRSALQLDSVSDPMREWYDAADRRRLIRRAAPRWRWRPTEELRLCIEAEDDLACETLARDRFEQAGLRPISPLANHTLLETAVQLGGDGAYGRMIRNEVSSVADWIAAVADAPADSVVAHWHSQVVATRPDRARLTATGGWGAVAWVLVLVAAATRSTRWRR